MDPECYIFEKFLTKIRLENLKSELESERKLRKLAETKAEKTSKASRKYFELKMTLDL